MVAIPRKDLVWLVRSMAAHYKMDPDKLERFVEAVSGFNRDYCGAYHRGLMAVPTKLVKQYKFAEKHMREWRDNVGVGFKVLAKLVDVFGGSLEKALAAYVMGSEDSVIQAVSREPRRWRELLPEEVRTTLDRVEVAIVQ